MVRQTTADRVTEVGFMVVVGILALACLLPFVNIAAIAFSSNTAVVSGQVSFFPIGFQVRAFEVVFQDRSMWRSFGFTVVLTATFTALTMVASVCAAYPLAQRRLHGRTGILLMISFTMFFSGGLIPGYLLVRGLGLMDTMWALILPGLISTWNMIIMKTFFGSLPAELEESARIDGANDIVILLRIILPVSTPMLAAIGLFYAVGRWNGFQDAVFFINDSAKYPLQLILNQIVMRGEVNQMLTDALDEEVQQTTPETLKAATLLFVTVPIILVYPWLQKYFVKGIMLGSIKG
jgi:putative aldouronate transport system permease protein